MQRYPLQISRIMRMLDNFLNGKVDDSLAHYNSVSLPTEELQKVLQEIDKRIREKYNNDFVANYDFIVTYRHGKLLNAEISILEYHITRMRTKEDVYIKVTCVLVEEDIPIYERKEMKTEKYWDIALDCRRVRLP